MISGFVPGNFRRRRQAVIAVLLSLGAIAVTARFVLAQKTTVVSAATLEPAFQQFVKPFFDQNCVVCHSTDLNTANIKVDQLDAKLEERHLPVWDAIRRKLREGSMPPAGMPQPSTADRQRMIDWITQALEVARLRPVANNGLIRRLTISQYRNTLKELLLLDDDLTTGLPPDAVSKDGFLNNKDTLQLSPILTESYLEVAQEALARAIVDPNAKPAVQNFRVDLGANVNPAPFPDKLILGDGSKLLNNEDVMVTQLIPKKPFDFNPVHMQTKWRFIEGYQGNDTVRGWREYDSIYHAVFADMRGSPGYPKGEAYSTVPQGLLLRPAIPTDETFGMDSTYGPKANFKISLRELPEYGPFRITVMAAKYNDGLLLDSGADPQTGATSVTYDDPATPRSITIQKAGIYQADLYPKKEMPLTPDTSRLTEGLAGTWPLKDDSGSLKGEAKLVDSPFGKAVSLSTGADSVAIPRTDAMNVGDGNFTISAWIHPGALRKSALIASGDDGMQGWYLETSDATGTLRLVTNGPDGQPNGTLSSPGRSLRPNQWQHIAVVVKPGQQSELKNEARMYVNGDLVARGAIGRTNLDNPKLGLRLGRIGLAQPFLGEMDQVQIYRRPLDEAEIHGLVLPGEQLIKPVPTTGPQARKPPPDVATLTLGDRQFSGIITQPAFVVVRLNAGPLQLSTRNTGLRDLGKVVLTPVGEASDLSKRFVVFEKRVPRLGIHVGLRRDCGSTLAPVGPPQTVGSETLTPYVFEGTLRNFPSPQSEKENVNYLQGVHEIGIRSEYTDGRDMPRLVIRSMEFEGPFYEQWPPAPHKAIFVDFDHKDDHPAYARKIIHDFATRAFRRPVTSAEEASLMAVYQRSSASGSSFVESVKDALTVALTSPQFLFLIENSKSPAPEPLDNYELASKLSYFLWNGPPDEKALHLAANGTLTKQLDSEVGRLIADPKFGRFVQEFASQWLQLDKFQVVEVDRKKFPLLSLNARSQLKQEPVEFVKYLLLNNLPVRDLIESDFVVANESVASYYDLADKPETGFGFVAVPTKRPDLGGLLTQPAILAGLSDGREGNPVKRGAWVARKIIAEPPSDPPPNVPPLKADTEGLTLRQRLEAHRTLPLCNQCHAKIDPWGLPFEQYSAAGRLRQDSVDASSTLPDKTQILNANDLRRYLADDRIDQVAFSFLKHLTTYGIGRTLTYNEQNFLKQDVLKLKAGGYRTQDMLRHVVTSKLFLDK